MMESQHPDLAGTGGAMRAEWREEQAAATDDAATQWRHRRALAEWFAERANAGDRVAATVQGQRFTGHVADVSADLVSLHCAFGRVDIHMMPSLSVVFEINDKTNHGGDRTRSGRSFHDALLLRDAQPDTTVGTVHDPEGLDGTMFVGQDFVSVVARLGAETVVPIDSITWLSARRT
jgi:hypothetical protein